MVDLAGSEKEPFSFSPLHMAGNGMEGSANNPNNNTTNNSSVKLDEELESRWIRRSLATLGQIIQSLSRGLGDRYATTSNTTNMGGMLHGSRHSGQGLGLGLGGGQSTLPYRDSALTWLLRNSLSGRY